MTQTKIFLDWHGPQISQIMHLSELLEILGFCKKFML